MFLNPTDEINKKISLEASLNKSDIIKDFIDEHKFGQALKNMIDGENYYNCQHDVLYKNFNVSVLSENDGDVEKINNFKNPNRSNHHNINPFHKILVDQKVSYIVGREPTITVKNSYSNPQAKLYEEVLKNLYDNKLCEVIQNLVTGACNKGFEVLHIFYDKNGQFNYTIIPAQEIIPIYDSEYGNILTDVIRYYDVTYKVNGQIKTKTKVQWWTDKDVTYFCSNENGDFFPDPDFELNPSPHWMEKRTQNGYVITKPHGWGRVPFIILKNNSLQTNDLMPIKGLIDAYDLISSEGTNNLLDLVDLYWVIEGYGGETANAIARKLQINKAVHISDNSGSVEAKQVELPMDGRIKWLDMLRRDIFHFGQGIDTDSDKFGNSPSGVSLKFQYSLLDLKANNIIIRLKAAIKDFIWFYTTYYNRKNNTDFNSKDVDIVINKALIGNDLELVNIISQSRGFVSDKTLLSKHPFVDDVNFEMEANKNL